MPLVLIVSLMLAACVGTGGKNAQPSGQSDLSTAIAIANVTDVGGRSIDFMRPLVVAALVPENGTNRASDREHRRRVLALTYRLIDEAMVAASGEADGHLVDGLARQFSAREQEIVLDFVNSSRGRSALDWMFAGFEDAVEVEVFGGSINTDAMAAELAVMARSQPAEVTRFLRLTAGSAGAFASALSRNLRQILQEIDRLSV